MDDGKEDRFNNSCANALFARIPVYCGYSDDDDFSANTMCCVCKGDKYPAFQL